ncbi:MAG TPA: hypothetical protein PKV43_05680, partial [Armatimonadota bacterium]|nr:hypothetical protein [Armatimonadota bacterium]
MGDELQDMQEENLIVDDDGTTEDEIVQADDAEEPEIDEAEGEVEQPEDSEDVPVEQKYEEISRNYQRLERKFTKVSQENAQLKQFLAEAQRAIDFYNAVAMNPELAANVNQLLDVYGATVPVQEQGIADFDPASERQVMRELLSRPDFVKHEEEIAEWAEDNGIPFETA